MKQKIVEKQPISGIRAMTFFMAWMLFYQTALAGYLQPVNTHKALLNAWPTSGFAVDKQEPLNAEIPEGLVRFEKPDAKPLPPNGPDQPEAQSFTPIDVSNMVNPFTGDFSYNIPLLDIDGYPINLAYNAGVSMDQEASWVGLGWNLNPGVINRTMRGIPDEFNGTEEVTRNFNMKDNWTIGGSFGMGFELFGFSMLHVKSFQKFGSFPIPILEKIDKNLLDLSFKIGVNWNNYNGFASELSISPSFNIYPNGLKNKYSIGLGISGSSSGGASVTPSLKYTEYSAADPNKVDRLMVLSFPINSRSGLNEVNYSLTKYTKARTHHGRTFSSSLNLGQSTYTPSISMPMKTFGMTFGFDAGPDAIGMDPSLSIKGYFSRQKLRENTRTLKAFGYQFFQKSIDEDEAMLDFNRDNDGPFTKSTPTLPVPNLTYDIFAVSGQGMSGSYRMQRMDMGYVFDPYTYSRSIDGSVGFEVGMGGSTKFGLNLAATFNHSASGVWDKGNQAGDYYRYSSDAVYFREANEMSVAPNMELFERIGGVNAVRFDINGTETVKNRLLSDGGQPYETIEDYERPNPEKQNQVMTILTREEYKKGFGIELDDKNSELDEHFDHHIAEMTTLDESGKRYVYGLPAYNKEQHEVTFSVDHAGSLTDYLTTVSATENSINNTSGTDHYFDETITPAYPHAFMLTSVLGSDFVDADEVKGPSAGDRGFYVHFTYNKVSNFGWRTPTEPDKAIYNVGTKMDEGDDKANLTYGTKDLYYVETIRTKNYVAIFHKSKRLDAPSQSANGDRDYINAMLKLDSIQLFAANDYDLHQGNAELIKCVHFEYSYGLCEEYPLHEKTPPCDLCPPNQTNNGKLTLKKVYFTYKKSQRGKYNPYEFSYFGENNAAYNFDRSKVDRWGNFTSSTGVSMNSNEFPYAGTNRAQRDADAAVWNLNEIGLPSGGKITVEYESDDYGYVQHLPAMNMLPISGIQDKVDHNQVVTSGVVPVASDDLPNATLYIDLIGDLANVTDAKQLLEGLENVYFRASMKFDDNQFELVPGFAKLDPGSGIESKPNQPRRLAIKFKPVTLKEKSNAGDYNPIAASAIHYGRMNLSQFLPPSNQESMKDGSDMADYARSLYGVLQAYGELFTGPNKALYNKQIGTELEIGKSSIRLKNPYGAKIGGGHRVKEIRISDEWDNMTSSALKSTYGQKYTYNDETGRSYGVASYEPMLGADENPFKVPLYSDEKYLLAPDKRNFKIEPFGESYFPSAQVGYSKVIIEDILPHNLKRHATGKVVHEFYTARDFPTITKRTNIDKSNGSLNRFKMPVFAYFFSMSIDEMAVSQGYYIENNDMHGKPKAQYVYAEDQSEPISKVEYFYQLEEKAVGPVTAKKLVNEVTAIEKDGSISTKTIGVIFEAVADMRQNISNMVSGTIQGNMNFTAPVAFFIAPYGTGSYERTAFHSATFTKVVERFGVLYKTVATDLGSVVETNTLAYDAETGAPLLTQTTTDFNDQVYSFTYPAHWYYDGMGHAYRNLGKTFEGDFTFVDGVCTSLSALKGFVPGDEVGVTLAYTAGGITTSQYATCWVVEADAKSIHLISKEGYNLLADNGEVKQIKILRSGRRNMPGTPIGTIVLKTNPLKNLKGNLFNQVLDAAAIEFRENWRTDCKCNIGENNLPISTNPYVLGTRGNWRPSTNYTHLTNRTQSWTSENSNIRVDGVFRSFTPFYKFQGNKWKIDRRNWTYISSVVEFNPNGLPLETVDALNRYSSTRYGFNNTLQTAVAVNTRYRELGNNSFEDPYIKPCDEKFPLYQDANISTAEAHTGKSSLLVSGSMVAVIESSVSDCDLPACDLEGQVSTTGPVYAKAIHGTAPYNFDTEIIYGGDQITNLVVNAAGDQLNITATGSWKIRVTITDSKGCATTKEISMP